MVVSILSPPGGAATEILTPARVSEIQSVCLLLCRMAEDDESAYQAREAMLRASPRIRVYRAVWVSWL